MTGSLKGNHTVKNILLITPMLDQGGLEKVCVRTARLLQSEYRVTVAVFDGRDIIYDVTGLDVVDLKLPSRPGKIGKALNVLKRAARLRRLKKRLKTDIAYGFGPTANISNALSKGRETVFSGMRSYLDLQDVRRIRLYAKRSDCLVCCSQLIADEVKEMFPGKKISVLYNPYNLQEISELSMVNNPRLPWKESAKRIPLVASMGRENDVKGFWHLLKAIAEVKRQGFLVRLIIIGEGSFLEYKKLAEDLGILTNVFFTGVQKNPYSYLKQADLYVLSSLNEGFPNALVEAMALSIPVLAVNCKSGPAEILMKEYKEVTLKEPFEADYGILLPEPGREKNLDSEVLEREERIMADAVRSLLQDPQKYAYYREQAKKRAAEFSDEAYSKNLVKMMQE